MPAEDSAPHVRWTTVVQALAAVAVPIVLAFVGNSYTAALKEREVQGRFVELALAILQTPPDPTTTNLRGWALHVVNEYSGVPMDSVTRTELQETVTLPLSQPAASQETPQGGLAAGTQIFVHLNLPYAARIKWARLYTPTKTTLVDRVLGPGVDSFPLPWGSTIFLTITNAQFGDSTLQKVDCSHGCTVEVPPRPN